MQLEKQKEEAKKYETEVPLLQYFDWYLIAWDSKVSVKRRLHFSCHSILIRLLVARDSLKR